MNAPKNNQMSEKPMGGGGGVVSTRKKSNDFWLRFSQKL